MQYWDGPERVIVSPGNEGQVLAFVNGINNPCPGGYRLPTETELESWNRQDAAVSFAARLKLPLAGFCRNDNGTLGSVGSHAYFWTSTFDGDFSCRLIIYSDSIWLSSSRASGASVRCIKD